MKKLKYLVYIMLVLQGVISTSCNEWLNLEPNDGVPRDKYWKTKEDVNSAVVGAYISMTNSDLMTRMFLYGEWRADMVTYSPTYINSNIEDVVNGEISADNSFLNWASFYTTINLCNTILKYAPQAQANDKSFSATLLKEYEAQAIAIRSLMYFYLVRSFGDVPLILEAYTNSSQEMSVAKSSQETILNQLVEDLTYAEKYIPYKYSSTDAARNKGKMTAYAVKALLADVYLWKEEYAKCSAKCDEIINSGQFALISVHRDEVILEGATPEENDTIYYPSETAYTQLYDQLYYKGNSTESIFEIQFSAEGMNPFYNYMNSSKGWLMVNEDGIANVFTPTGFGKNNYFDVRKVISQRMNRIWKYIGVNLNTERQLEEYTSNFIVYRLAEIYLMKGEALSQMAIQANDDWTMLKEARALIEKVRVRANAVESTDLTYKQPSYSGKTLEQFILDERAREFVFEGKRWFDVLRQAKRGNYAGDNLHYLIDLAGLSAPPEKTYILQTKYKNFGSHYLPIYQDELEANPALVQNDFYATNN
ncbi:MAG TPA: RagB/SusD family nutrient uptake outer membrane protein [Bacteroides reticulotermitis]|nr:RagB/SusD family nutrient uptake outer membrane protein [Bacteroides reticulotermitis]